MDDRVRAALATNATELAQEIANAISILKRILSELAEASPAEDKPAKTYPIDEVYGRARGAYGLHCHYQNRAGKWATSPVPWEKLTAGQQSAWCQIVKALLGQPDADLLVEDDRPEAERPDAYQLLDGADHHLRDVPTGDHPEPHRHGDGHKEHRP